MDNQNAYLSIKERLMLLKINFVGQKIIDDRESSKYQTLIALQRMGYIEEIKNDKFPARYDDHSKNIYLKKQ